MRYLQPYIQRDLTKKMVFVGGPRQAGKTTLAKAILERYESDGIYLNWDDEEHRRSILARSWKTSDRLIIFDELHKYGRWKSWLKGVFDTRPPKQTYMVTGSARLDVYRRGGDSMMGRYHHWRLHPFCLAELPKKMTPQEGLRRLMTVGGFPEPFLDGDPQSARRWRRERRMHVFREDIRDLENLRDLSAISLLMDLLQRRVGGQVVVANLAQDLGVAHKTVKHWLEVLARMYLIFAVFPYHKGMARALVKPPKVYFFDNMDVEGDEGSRFENCVATHLRKRLDFLEDSTGHAYALHYVRDREAREVDFVVLKDGAVDALIEAKWADDKPSRSLAYFASILHPRKVMQIVGQPIRGFDHNGIQVRPAYEILQTIDMDV